MKEGKCPLFEICNCKTAICRCFLPDETCYYYRFFRDLIKGSEENG